MTLGEMVKKEERDEFLDEIDRELATLNKRLKSVLSEADALLAQHLGKETAQEPQDGIEPGDTANDD